MIIAISLAGAGILWYSNRRSARPPVQALNAVPLTTYPGLEQDPSSSPDGTQIAFSWKGEKQDNFDIWVKVVGNQPAMRLTNNPAKDHSSASSPDGRWIAFCRDLPRDGMAIFLTAPIPGPERPNDYSIKFLKAVGGKPDRIFGSDRPIDWFTVSPDRRWILYNQDNVLDSDLMLVENFR